MLHSNASVSLSTEFRCFIWKGTKKAREIRTKDGIWRKRAPDSRESVSKKLGHRTPFIIEPEVSIPSTSMQERDVGVPALHQLARTMNLPLAPAFYDTKNRHYIRLSRRHWNFYKWLYTVAFDWFLPFRGHFRQETVILRW